MVGSIPGGREWLEQATDDRLIIEESRRRTSGEIAAALASMRLARAARGSRARARMIAEAVERLEGFGGAHAILSAPTGPAVDLTATLERLCRSMVRARRSAGGLVVDVRLAPLEVDATTARRALHICHELLADAIALAIDAGGGRVVVELHAWDGRMALMVSDEVSDASPRFRQSPGCGPSLATELVRRSGGSFEFRSGPEGTSVHVGLAYDPALVARRA